MGYCVTIDIQNLIIPKENIQNCLNAINNLYKPEMIKLFAWGGSPKEKCYSFTYNPENGKWDDIKEAFDSWRYETEFDENENLVIIMFEGEKWGDDEVLYNTIAPFVQNGAIITIYGEDHEQWSYQFENQEIYHCSHKIVLEKKRKLPKFET